MAWTPSAPLLPRTSGAAPVPDIEGLRRTALHASWRRDRRVARRRMAMRWVVWYAVRGLPLLAIATAVWLWVSQWPAARQSHSVQAATIVPAPVPSAPVPHLSEPVLQLRLESPFQPILTSPDPPFSSVPFAGKTASVPDLSSPQLKPDNWLHSKEP